ncbi:sensor histidine kinase [Paenibacillus ginsengarvi]|uniref:histidine kinase n=1 Tax=Paenibacillus ginsengarvi TaxID=400777 RepID=A0A3B0CSU6_9BACL|nr:HAMP domain-containing sensor histidine kinase [Paenibacillus ginsengarvi]RKN86594.1 sensor histidine kinase [Paenibacillus ginsengarvi]
MKRLSPKLKLILISCLLFIGVFSWLTVCWIGAFYLMEVIPWEPAPLLDHLITSGLGFLLFGFTMMLISLFTRKRRDAFLQSIMDALRRIAKGDFRVKIPLEGEWNDGQMSFLVRGINDMAADLEKIEVMRQEFISSVSHEIQSPLTSIGGFARVLKEGDLSYEQRVHYLDIIEQESVRLSRLSDNMLKLASLDSDKHPFNPVDLRLDKQLQRVILAAEPQWAAKNLELSAQLEPVQAQADADLLEQVWTNLLHNAVKFTPENGTILVTLLKTTDEAVVTFEDSGAGIPEESIARVFDRFYKADPSRTRKGGGSGLGLSISRKIVEMHGGTITAANGSERGAVMTVRLPVRHQS